jgi:hypothetical protein
MFPKKYLTDQQLLALKPKSKIYKISMGRALLILMNPNGSLYWRFRYRFAGKEKTLSIGIYPAISIVAAHDAANEARELLKQGIDPSTFKREQKREIKEEEKIKLKAARAIKPLKTAFSLNLATDGGLIITRIDKTFSLTPAQTNALKSFLNVAQQEALDE